MTRYVDPGTQYTYTDPISNVFGPVKLGKLFFYKSQTTTPLATYADSLETIPNSDPVVLDSDGRVPNIFFSGSARVVLRDENDQLIFDKDPVGGENVFGQLSLWDSVVIYESTDYVIGSDSNVYKSRSNDNQGNDPVSSPSDWIEVEFLEDWNSTVPYNVGDLVKTVDGNLWKSLTSINLNNDPVTDNGTNWTPAIDASKSPSVIILETRTTTVIPQTGGGLLTALRNNELQDGSTYQIPLANSVLANQTITISQPDEFSSNEPIAEISGSDTISYSGGSDSEIKFDSGRSIEINLTSDGVNNWSL